VKAGPLLLWSAGALLLALCALGVLQARGMGGGLPGMRIDALADIDRLAATGNVDAAIAQCRLHLQIDPTNHAEVHNTLGTLYLRQGNIAASVESLEQALALDPMLVEAWNNRGVAEAQQGRIAAATEHFLRALEISPTSAEARDNLLRARDWFVQQTAQRPGDPAIRQVLARIDRALTNR
jgi:tetratricopeptide (TPR) repeat protein